MNYKKKDTEDTDTFTNNITTVPVKILLDNSRDNNILFIICEANFHPDSFEDSGIDLDLLTEHVISTIQPILHIPRTYNIPTHNQPQSPDRNDEYCQASLWAHTNVRIRNRFVVPHRKRSFCDRHLKSSCPRVLRSAAYAKNTDNLVMIMIAMTRVCRARSTVRRNESQSAVSVNLLCVACVAPQRVNGTNSARLKSIMNMSSG